MKKQKNPSHLYLIYGNNETAVANAHFELVNSLLTKKKKK